MNGEEVMNPAIHDEVSEVSTSFSDTFLPNILEWEYATVLLFIVVLLLIVVISGVMGAISKYRDDKKNYVPYGYWDHWHHCHEQQLLKKKMMPMHRDHSRFTR